MSDEELVYLSEYKSIFCIFSGRRFDQRDDVLYHITNKHLLRSASPSREEMESSSPSLRSISKQRQKLDLNNLFTVI
jgi:hypothetical protein